ncbi:hypothetical protein MJO28_015608 [Puccinia striiformis f. sp. tritici]|uniref:Uncharacterized protein n=1 Tax=Puccinia striiformis f. sp. tritici TaxID=168172 RepID=A0ACC0DS12_9BASI|nr:hypothetical protein MJO28_015608 [Puccinia striiformis f. sp. tritici]
MGITGSRRFSAEKAGMDYEWDHRWAFADLSRWLGWVANPSAGDARLPSLLDQPSPFPVIRRLTGTTAQSSRPLSAPHISGKADIATQTGPSLCWQWHGSAYIRIQLPTEPLVGASPCV